MDFKAHARHGLGVSRRLMEGAIAAFQSQDDWFCQVHPKANHPLWVVGHLGLADNLYVSRFRPQLAQKPEGWDKLFWFGSEPTQDRAAYPPPEDVLAYFRERRETLLRVLNEVTEEELNAPAPPPGARSPIAGAPNLGQIFLFAPVHEGLHLGQLTVAHRARGYPPVIS